MSETSQPHGEAPPRDVYSFGYGEWTRQWMRERSASNFLGFFLPHLRPGMSLLDCGCGPGSLTIDLATMLTPGQVVGIDVEEAQIDAARALAAERRIANVRFAVESAYALPFASSSFEAVLASMVLMHVRDPLSALKEMRRVLKSGGVIAVQDVDWGTQVWTPTTPLLEEWRALTARVRLHNGGSPYYPRQQRQLLREAGFARSEGFALAFHHGTPASTKHRAQVMSRLTREPAFADTAIRQGWADTAMIDAMCAELQRWGERPDAFWFAVTCAAVGWVDEADADAAGAN